MQQAYTDAMFNSPTTWPCHVSPLPLVNTNMIWLESSGSALSKECLSFSQKRLMCTFLNEMIWIFSSTFAQILLLGVCGGSRDHPGLASSLLKCKHVWEQVAGGVLAYAWCHLLAIKCNMGCQRHSTAFLDILSLMLALKIHGGGWFDSGQMEERIYYSRFYRAAKSLHLFGA